MMTTCVRMLAGWSVLLLLLQACGAETRDEGGSDTGGDNPCALIDCEPGSTCIAGECVEDTTTCVDGDGDGYGPFCEAGDDCDDTHAEINPGREEICDDLDNDCDFTIDEDNVCVPCTPSCTPGESLCSGEDVVFCDDSDGCASFGEPQACPSGEFCRDGACVERCADVDGDGFGVLCGGDPSEEDCDDARSDVYPGAPELCDALDNNCDRRVDENFVCDEECEDECEIGTVTCTGDGRGFVSCERRANGCTQFTGVIACSDGRFCSEGRCVNEAVCIDVDADGYGPGCDAGEDCRPADGASYLGATEVCDGLDNDCNGVADDGGVCVPCPGAPLDAPASLSAGDTLYRVSCGGSEYVSIDSPGSNTISVIAGADDAVPGLALGAPAGTFPVEGLPIGGATQAIETTPLAGGMLARVDVPAGTAYRVAVNRFPGSCSSDAFEPNNSPGAATILGRGGSVASATACAGDFDFYEVEAAEGDIVRAELAFDSEAAVLLASVWRNGNEVSPSFGGPAGAGGQPIGRAAHFRADLPGTYTIGVRGFSPAASNGYALHVTSVDGGACSDDSFEGSGVSQNDSVPTAAPLSRGQTVNGVLCAGDYDIYALGNLDGGTVGGSFTPSATEGEIEIFVLYGGWEAVRDFGAAASRPGSYYIAVFGSSPTASGTYELTWE